MTDRQDHQAMMLSVFKFSTSLVAAICGIASLLGIFSNCQAQAQQIDFETQIAPIFEERCFGCHGEDDQESGLRLDQRAIMLLGGDTGLATLVPGNPEKSYLLEVITHADEEMAMPPDEDKLPDEEIALITQWIKEGANWPGQMDTVVEKTKSDHWSFQPVVRPEVPGVDDKPESPVDAFLLKQLSENELTFSETADPQSLIRRASIVLTGLAPTAEETNQFVTAFENHPETSYAKLVDRLLASPHFGERWGQHWLDVIRWAETNGSEANLYRKNAWHYRDYVVRAFNEDKPYDQFIQEQIAGDSLGAGVATGFLVSGPHVPAATVGREESAIRQARADRMDEIVQTVGASLMGVTMGCARCHNHKFDPISITDYYSMTGVFQDVEFGGRFPEYAQDHPLKIRSDEISEEIEQQRAKLTQFGGWEENWGAYRELHFKTIKTKGVRINFKQSQIFIDELEVFGPENSHRNLVRSDTGTKLTAFPAKGFEDRNPASLINDGQYGTMVWRVKLEKNAEEKAWVQFNLNEPTDVNRLRISNNREYYYDVDYLTKKHNLAKYEFDLSIQKEDGTWQPWVGTWYVKKKLNQDHPERKKMLNKLQAAIKALEEEGPRASFVGRFIQPDTTYVLHRGSPENRRDEVSPSGPKIFDGDLGLTSDASGSDRRAKFAKWLSSQDNPLTARVMANRIWHHVFGMGIVPTTADFGKAGAPPSHPELLDWLAAELVDPTISPDATSKAWSMKSMIRLLVMSQAFRQSSLPNELGLKKDAGSSLLWRFPPKRVEAEVIRDSVLQASGSLDRTIGGKSYRIHNEKKTYAQWKVLDNRGSGTWRRMLYQERMRRVDDGMFTAFDFPDCGQVRAKRPVSTTPLQALNLMNSDFVIEQSELIAKRAEKDSADNKGAAVDRCFELLLGRKPDETERETCVAIAEEDGLSLVCRALINSNEFAFLP